MSEKKLALVVGVIAATRLKFGDRLFEPGDALELPRDEEFERLLAGGAIQLAPADAGAGAGGGDDNDKMTVAEAIVELSARVAANSVTKDDAFTQAGKPDCNALEGILGREVSAAERDEAWEQVQRDADDAGNDAGNQE